MSLGVHLLGPGFGESIILEFPDRRIGVIDTYCHGMYGAIVPQFLRQRFAVSELLFFAVTHPHADHCMGASEILKSFAVEQLWAFDAVQLESLVYYYRDKDLRKETDPVEEALKLKPGTVLAELLELRRAFADRIKRNTTGRIRFLRSGAASNLCENAITIKCLTPGDSALARFRERLLAALNQSVSPPKGDETRMSRDSVNQNLASGALLIEYGKTRILLMADAEVPLWNDWTSESENTPTLRFGKVNLLKVGHHGSSNGYHEQIYAESCIPELTIAVMTPFIRNVSPLPSTTGIDSICLHARTVVCTNREAAQASSGYLWQPAQPTVALVGTGSTVPPKEASRLQNLAVPPEWIAAIQKEPRLLNLLAPPYGRGDVSGQRRSVPPRWVADCHKRPELLAFLHPNVGGINRTPPQPDEPRRPTAFDEFLVSFYFNSNGHEERDKRYIGSGAGTLKLNSQVKPIPRA
jgi:hypothetical protein